MRIGWSAGDSRMWRSERGRPHGPVWSSSLSRDRDGSRLPSARPEHRRTASPRSWCPNRDVGSSRRFGAGGHGPVDRAVPGGCYILSVRLQQGGATVGGFAQVLWIISGETTSFDASLNLGTGAAAFSGFDTGNAPKIPMSISLSGLPSAPVPGDRTYKGACPNRRGGCIGHQLVPERGADRDGRQPDDRGARAGRVHAVGGRLRAGRLRGGFRHRIVRRRKSGRREGQGEGQGSGRQGKKVATAVTMIMARGA